MKTESEKLLWVVLGPCGSTNDVAFAYLDTYERVGVFSAEQQSGRGSKGRSWLSPRHTGIALSVGFLQSAWQEHIPHPLHFNYPLFAGWYVCDWLSRHFPNTPFRVKWPNDIWVDGKKLGGILCESRMVSSQLKLVIGIGINLKKHNAYESLNRPLTFLEDFGPVHSPKEIAYQMGEGIPESIAQFKTTRDFLPLWEHYSVLAPGQSIAFETDGEKVQGTYEGLDVDGKLRVQTPSGARLISQACDEFKLLI
ncbi:MAG: biotin--[acetyl-CoA-carboxylase] ligase [Acidobacteria bacterium]|nr:biotin--[acetyl-CoA-carboxylase] ligase [Acidobacteriota bacterium]MCB9396969.1 biotin--[acetyl-CoA-carboxylase] ligase [Acidobacteriota bacterium]